MSEFVLYISWLVLLILLLITLFSVRKSGSKIYGTLTVGVFAAILVYRIYNNYSSDFILTVLFTSVYETFQVFLFNIGVEELRELPQEVTAQAIVIRALISGLYLFASLLLVSGVFAIALKSLNYIKYGLIGRKELYYFSELNKKSMQLAISIYEKRKSVNIIFCDVEKDSPLVEEYEAELKNMHCLLLAKNITTLPLNNKKRCKKTLFLIKTLEELNLNDSLTLINKYHDLVFSKKIDVYVFSNMRNSVEFLDAIGPHDKMNFNIRLFNEATENALQLLLQHPLYLAPGVNEHRKVNVLIVGLGTVGVEMLKTILWCGQMLSYQLEIHVIDQIAMKIKKQFESECSGFYSSGNKIIKDIDELVHFYCVDVSSSEFDQKLKELDKANYIVVCLDTDEKTIDTAIKIRRQYIRNYMLNESKSNKAILQPNIYPLVRDEEKYVIVNELSKEYQLTPFGRIQDTYNYNNIMDGLLDQLDVFVQFAYSKTQNQKVNLEDCYYTREIDRRSNRAFVLHAFYKLWDLGYLAEVNKEQISRMKGLLEDENMLNILENNVKYQSFLEDLKERSYSKWFEDMVFIEKRRWNIFKICEGWIGLPFEKAKQYEEELCLLNKRQNNQTVLKQEMSRLNTAIISMSELVKMEESMDCNILIYDKSLTELIIKTIILISDVKKGVDGNLYTPKPENTSDIVLSQELMDLCEALASNTHDIWAQGRINDGWTFGPERNDALKKHPCLVPYEELPESERLYDRQTAMETLKLITKLGFNITK